MVGRARSYPGSPCGTTRLSMSAPPRSESATSTLGLVAASAGGANVVWRNAEPNIVAPEAAVRPRRKLRRLVVLTA